MRHPDLINFLNKDFYVSPVSIEEPSQDNLKDFTLLKGADIDIADLKVKFTDFDFNNFQKGAMLEGKGFVIKADLDVIENGKKKQIVLKMENSGQGSGPEFIPATYVAANNKSYEFKLIRIQPDKEDKSKSKVEFSVKMPQDPSAPQRGETLVVEASVKPMINLVWMGTVTLIVGFALTIARRSEEARMQSDRWLKEE
ncbi:MAG: hypothetical protein HY089_02740 [Ignavibacteriales bacterium]|nr:hypothetical protein [Ignavibacteriales bacterium]